MARQPTPNKQRTLIVLGTLLAAMTTGAALLLILEPSAVAPGDNVRLLQTDADASDPAAVLFDTAAPLNWSAIVIYDSGSLEGTAQTIHKVHQRLGLGGLGYHFVVDNGQGAPDGQVEIGYRWKQQLIGAHAVGPNSDQVNRQAIGICLIGDTDRGSPSEAQLQQLTWLVQQLQARFNIPAGRVFLQTGSGRTGTRNLFPAASFRQQLLLQR